MITDYYGMPPLPAGKDLPQFKNGVLEENNDQSINAPILPPINMPGVQNSNNVNPNFAMPEPRLGPELPRGQIERMKDETKAAELKSGQDMSNFNTYMKAASGMLGQIGGAFLDEYRNWKANRPGPREYAPMFMPGRMY